MTPVADGLITTLQDSTHVQEEPVHSPVLVQHHLLTNGGGGETNERNSATLLGGDSAILSSSTTGVGAPSANGPTKSQHEQQNSAKKVSAISSSKDSSQKDRSSGLTYKDREERVRQLRERQQTERQQKLEELKEQAASAQRFREQQEAARRQRLEEMRNKDSERRTQVEERKRIIQQAEQERREAVLRKSAERETRLDLKRRQERSNAVFAFGSSTPRMLDPKESAQNYFGGRRATSTTNVNLSESSSAIRPSECQEPTDLSRKRATSAHSLNRKPEGDDTSTRPFAAPPPTAARRRTDLLPTFPSHRDATLSSRGSPRHRSPGRANSLGRLDQLSRPRPQRPPSLAPLHETSSSRVKSMKPVRTMSKSMSHLGPQRARTPIGSSTDGSGVPVTDGQLDRRSSRSSLALSQPKMTRAEMRRLSKLRGGSVDPTGVRSGTTTPGSPSRPTSSLSQSSGVNSQVLLRTRASPKKPRPLSIAGSTLSSADKPKEGAPAAVPPAPVSPNRESRSIDRKLSNGSITSKPARAKSVGSDRSTPSTPAKTPRVTAPKRTPAQVKAESAARKASKPRSTPKTTPVQSPSVESKSVVGMEKPVPKPKPSKETKPKEVESEVNEAPNFEPEKGLEQPKVEADCEPIEKIKNETVTEDVTVPQKPEEIKDVTVPETREEIKDEELKEIEQIVPEVTPSEPGNTEVEAQVSQQTSEDQTQLLQRAAEKPVAGYASEEDYKVALAEKRRQAREAKEREIELERQRQLDKEEQERREEEEYLKLMEEQKKAEEERLRKAIEEAERLRVEEAKIKEEEEKQRIETEKIELQKKLEAEEKMKKEEEDRQMRKSRVAAIMSRTRGKGPASTPTKDDSKTPSDEMKNLNDSLMSSSISENLLNTISSSMTDSMIVHVLENQQPQKGLPSSDQSLDGELPISSASSQPPSDISSQPLSDMSNQAESLTSVDSNPQLLINTRVETQVQDGTTTTTFTESRVVVEENLLTGTEKQAAPVPDIASVNILEAQVNGTAPLTPMDTTTPTNHSVDLLGSFSGVNGINHNGVTSVAYQSPQRPDNQFDSLDPLCSPSQTILTTETKTETTFDQIIDLNQTKLTNEDAVNSNPPPPIIAFEDNLNKKSQQTQETTSNVPDLLL